MMHRGKWKKDIRRFRREQSDNIWKRIFFRGTVPGTTISVVQIEMKGPDNSLRVRQIRLLGEGVAGSALTRSFNAAAVHQRTCETETLRVFRLLTSQVFGRLVSYEGEASNSNHEPAAAAAAAAAGAGAAATTADADFIELSNESAPDGERMDNDLKEHMVCSVPFTSTKLSLFF